MKNILHVFPTFSVGGSQVRLSRLLNASSSNDDLHQIIALNANYDAKALCSTTASILWSDHDISSRLPLPARLSQIKDILLSERPDVLMTYNWGSIEWALVNNFRTRFRHIHWEDGFGPDEQYKLKTRRNFSRKVILARSHRIIVPSQNLASIAQRNWGLSADKIQYFPNGISIPNDTANVSRQVPVLATLATLRPEKNIDRLIRAVASLSIPVELHIAGDGPEKQKLEALTNELGLSKIVNFYGHTDDVYGFLREASIFCLSSNTEQMPISVLEAMAVGLPVVSTDVGDVPQMVSDENRSFVVPPDSFEKALSEMISQPNLWATLGGANRQKAITEFSFDQMLRRFQSLCQS